MGMEGSGGMSPADVVALQGRNNDGMFSGNDTWIWVFFLFFLLAWGGNGFGFGGGNGLTQAELQAGLYNQTTDAMLRDLSNGQCTLRQEVAQSRYDNALQMQTLGSQMQNCCCETNRNIDAVRAENYKNTCEITTAIHAEGEATRALINANTMQDLRDKLADRDRELQTANFHLSQQAQNATLINTLRPFPQPAYITCSPYTAMNGYGACNGCTC